MIGSAKVEVVGLQEFTGDIIIFISAFHSSELTLFPSENCFLSPRFQIVHQAVNLPKYIITDILNFLLYPVRHIAKDFDHVNKEIGTVDYLNLQTPLSASCSTLGSLGHADSQPNLTGHQLYQSHSLGNPTLSQTLPDLRLEDFEGGIIENPLDSHSRDQDEDFDKEMIQNMLRAHADDMPEATV